MHYAADAWFAEAFVLLKNWGANVNAHDKDRLSPALSAWKNDQAAFLYLYDLGAEIDGKQLRLARKTRTIK